MERDMEVICSGLNVVDLLVSSPETIAFGQKNECEKIIIQGGAPAGNAACGLAALGHDTAFLGYLGENTLSEIAKAELLRHGVKPTLFKEKKEATPAIAIVQINSEGERTVLYSMNGYAPFQPEDLDESAIKNCKLILVDGYDAVINTHLLKLAKKYGIATVLDLEKADEAVMKEMVSLTSHAILPLETAQALSGKTSIEDCVEAIAQFTNAQVVVTDGSNGSFAMDNGKLVHQPSFKVEVVDTTGCGDSFHAAYASALLQGMDLPQRMEYASFFAAQVATVFGGRTHFPSREFMEKHLHSEVMS
ncbi:PfkB family carbohydrate kinase [Flammeovirgaceae bacterium SG7u.111]|nr:PfkB family carbohydrate kinase [Flammeovirgaceae bacterium SG7u.132]WPO37503.1 PfkB family carbohydrate kinase [Flammeovirgaceae bacterium SG7u.111]